MRRIIVFGLVILSLCMFPSLAFAGGTEQVVSDAGDNVMVVAYNRFNAALLMLGVSPNDTRLDAIARAKLSNASTGGRFYELVQDVEQYDGLDVGDVFGSIGFGVLRLPWVAYCAANGMHIYTYAGSRDGALEDLLVVLGGGDLGGGSGGGGSGDYYTFTDGAACTWWNGSTAIKGTDGVNYSFYTSDNMLPNPINIDVGKTLLDDVIGDANTDVWVRLKVSGNFATFAAIALPTDGYDISWATWGGKNSLQGFYNINGGYKELTINYKEPITYDNTTKTVTYNAGMGPYVFTAHQSTSFYYVGGATDQIWAKYGGGSSTPVLPPSNWPDDPIVTTPEPPEVPTDTPVYPPQVTGPDVTVPQTPDLSDVLDALNEHCEHLQDAIYNGFDDYYETITSYYSDVVDWLQEWLEYFDRVFDDAFDDISLYQRTGNYWLNQIYNKLDDINKKLDGLADKIDTNDIPSTYDNSNVATDGSNVLAGAYNSLRTKFPFSLLDSLAGFATRLKHQAVAPDFDLPVGNPFGSHDPFTVEIDLTPYSDWAAIVRTGEVLAVYVALARRAAAMWTREGEGA